jgi:hypothetical protein
MTKTKTAADFRAEAAQHRQDVADSWERSDTDGFLSQWASGLNAQLADTKARLAEQGNRAWFARYILTDAETGEKIENARLVDTRFGRKWVVDTDSGTAWINHLPARKATQTRKGFVEAVEIFEAEAFAKMDGRGTGLSGTAWVGVHARLADGQADWKAFEVGESADDARAWFDRVEQDGRRLFPSWLEVREAAA